MKGKISFETRLKCEFKHGLRKLEISPPNWIPPVLKTISKKTSDEATAELMYLANDPSAFLGEERNYKESIIRFLEKLSDLNSNWNPESG